MAPKFELFGLTLPGYGAAVATGVVLGYVYAWLLGKRSPLGSDHATTLFLIGIAGAFGGAKMLGFIVEGRADMASGGVFLGGYIGVAVTVLIAAGFLKIDRIEALDLASPAGAMGHVFGRLGCLLAGCCYGKPTESGLGLAFGRGSVAHTTLAVNHPDLVHGDWTTPLIPTQGIEAGFELVVALGLGLLLVRGARRGLVMSLYLLAYSGFRFVIEFFRFDPERGYVIEGVLSTSQTLSIALFALGLWALWALVLRGPRSADARAA